MVEIELIHVSNYILDNVSIVFPSKKLSVVIGPNGAGKTTLLKVIAGLTTYSGMVLFDKVRVDNIPPYMRGLSIVPQNNVLFHNMTVYDNIAFPLRIRGYSDVEIKEFVYRVAEKLGIDDILDRYPHMISWGEAKRVALARGLVFNAETLLIDEPFANLDVESRYVVKKAILDLVRMENKTIVLVSHMIDEILSISSTVTIMWRGRVLYSGEPWRLSNEYLPLETRFWLGSILSRFKYRLVNDLCFIEVNGIYLPIECIDSKVEKVLIPSYAIELSNRGDMDVRVNEVFKDHGLYSVEAYIGDDTPIYFKTPYRVSKGEHLRIKIRNVIPLTNTQ